jgi:hypothetical protein
VSLGDPAFGHTFEAMRGLLVDRCVQDMANKWECCLCGARWDELPVPHAPDCILGATPRAYLTSSQRP